MNAAPTPDDDHGVPAAANRFLTWLRGLESRAPEPAPPPDADALDALAADAIAYADVRRKRLRADEAITACERGCCYCCHLPVRTTVAEGIAEVYPTFAERVFAERALET